MAQNRIYHEKALQKTQEQITMLGLDLEEVKPHSMRRLYHLILTDAATYRNVQLLTSLIMFFLVLYCVGTLGYVLAPTLTVAYYYLFHYLLIQYPLKKRSLKLDREALNFFEILTLTLESGRNLEHSLEVTVFNVNTEIAQEFKKTLFEVKFGKSLLEALEDMKKRIPSENINNILLNITQTNVFGNSIVETMYNQVDFLREKQILEIKGQINKIPNKISIVSVIFIVPLILILVLGPFLLGYLG